jgi:hypothetical protein
MAKCDVLNVIDFKLTGKAKGGFSASVVSAQSIQDSQKVYPGARVNTNRSGFPY